MAKNAASPKTAVSAKKKPDDLAALVAEVRDLIQSARRAAAAAVDTIQVHTNFQIGRRIVEHEQKGEKRAGYGQELLKNLSVRLTEEFGKGFSARNLRNFRAFFLTYQERGSEIWQQPTAKSLPEKISQQPTGQLTSLQNWQQPSAKSPNPFSISWTHYVLLLTLKDPDERSFYEIESSREGWSVPELKRQVASSLYERLALSRKKGEVRRLAAEGQIISRPEDLLKEPYVLEFLGLDEKARYSESDLEQAIIDRIERFLLELGKGFLFESRQRRFTFDEDLSRDAVKGHARKNPRGQTATPG